jgi:hydrogenase-4 component F
MASLVALLCVPPAAVAAVLVAPARTARPATVTAGCASLVLAGALAFAVRDGDVLTGLGGWLRLDSLGAVFLLPVGLLYATAAAFSLGYLRPGRDLGFVRRYYAYLNVFGWTMLLVPLAADFGSLWIAVELTTIVSALLVASSAPTQRSRRHGSTS